jgi:hypothetical protein
MGDDVIQYSKGALTRATCGPVRLPAECVRAPYLVGALARRNREWTGLETDRYHIPNKEDLRLSVFLLGFVDKGIGRS